MGSIASQCTQASAAAPPSPRQQPFRAVGPLRCGLLVATRSLALVLRTPRLQCSLLSSSSLCTPHTASCCEHTLALEVFEAPPADDDDDDDDAPRRLRTSRLREGWQPWPCWWGLASGLRELGLTSSRRVEGAKVQLLLPLLLHRWTVMVPAAVGVMQTMWRR